jgi:hypothetical protein
MKRDYAIELSLMANGVSFITTGSFLVNKDTANDIDLVVVYSKYLNKVLLDQGFVQTNNKDYKKGGGAPTIDSTWRKGSYNIIVVHDIIAFALWAAFSNIISNKEYEFTDKSARIKLHELITSNYKELKNYA